jgi:hypothetical protein
VAAPLVEAMKTSSVASALRRALRYAIVTAIVAIVCSSLLPETDAERLATIVYLAVIFAAVAVTALHFVPAGASAERPLVVTLPAALQSVVLVAIILAVGAFFAGAPGAEAFLLLVCATLVAVMALWGNGLFAALSIELAGGDVPAMLTRYGVLVGILGMVLAIIVPAEMQPFMLGVACWAVVGATIGLSASLISRTSSGRFAMALFKDAPILFFERTASYAAYACAGALLVASLWPRTAQISALCAYVAIIIATVGVAIEIRLGLVADSRRATSISNPR